MRDIFFAGEISIVLFAFVKYYLRKEKYSNETENTHATRKIMMIQIYEAIFTLW